MGARDFPDSKSLCAVWALLGLVVALRIFDVFLLRSDEMFGELLVTKLGGLLLIAGYLVFIRRKPRAIGFHGDQGWRCFGSGLLLMATALAVGYLAELLFLLFRGESPALYWAAEGYSLLAKPGMSGGLVFALGLVAGNAINSTMEEGLFRGVLLTQLGARYRPHRANLTQALLFGLWHVVWPLRDWLDGKTPASTALGMAVGYVALSGLIGWIFGAVFQRTGSLWWPWAAHTLNNSSHNLLHMAIASGVAPTLGLRVAVATLCLGLLAIPWLRRACAVSLRSTAPERAIPSHL